MKLSKYFFQENVNANVLNKNLKEYFVGKIEALGNELHKLKQQLSGRQPIRKGSRQEPSRLMPHLFNVAFQNQEVCVL